MSLEMLLLFVFFQKGTTQLWRKGIMSMTKNSRHNVLLPCADPNLCPLRLWEDKKCSVWCGGFHAAKVHSAAMSCKHKDFLRKAQGHTRMVKACNVGWAPASRDDYCLNLPSPEKTRSSES